MTSFAGNPNRQWTKALRIVSTPSCRGLLTAVKDNVNTIDKGREHFNETRYVIRFHLMYFTSIG